MALLLKFLSGTQAGAEALLPDGNYVLGSGDAADLILADVAVRERHAILYIAGGTCEVSPENDAEVRLDGAVIPGRVPLSMYQVLTLGGVHIAIGPDGAWRQMPVIPSLVQAAGGAASAVPGDATESAGSSGRASGNKYAQAVNQDAPPKTSRGTRWSCLLIPLFFAAALFVGLYFFHRHVVEYLVPKVDDVSALRVSERLAAGGINVSPAPAPGRVAVVDLPGGRVELSGLVLTEAERLAVADTSGIPLDRLVNRVISLERELEMLQGELAVSHPGIQAARTGNGFAVLLYGIAERDADAASAFRLARERLGPLASVKRNLWVWRELKRDAEREAERLGMANARFVRNNGIELLMEANQWPSSALRRELLGAFHDRFGMDIGNYFASALDNEPEIVKTPVEPLPEEVVTIVDVPVPPPPPEPEPEEMVPEETIGEKETTLDEPPPVIVPLPEFWQVTAVDGNGFFDHQGKHWRIGDVVSGTLRLVNVWHGGAIFQNGNETIFIRLGQTMFVNPSDVE